MGSNHTLGTMDARGSVRDCPASLWELSLILRDIASNAKQTVDTHTRQEDHNSTQAEGDVGQLAAQELTSQPTKRISGSKRGNESGENVVE